MWTERESRVRADCRASGNGNTGGEKACHLRAWDTFECNYTKKEKKVHKRKDTREESSPRSKNASKINTKERSDPTRNLKYKIGEYRNVLHLESTAYKTAFNQEFSRLSQTLAVEQVHRDIIFPMLLNC